MGIKGFFAASGLLFKLAKEACDRLNAAPSDLEPNQNDAAVAIVFSAATLEALVAELGFLSQGLRGAKGVHQAVGLLADALNELERQRASVRLKLLIAKGMLPGEPFDTGKLPFQDLALLIDLRDSLVHLKPVETTDGSHKLLRAVQSRGICEAPKGGMHVGWLFQILTRACALWSTRVVEQFVDRVRNDVALVPALGESFLVVVDTVWGNGVTRKDSRDSQ